ncbi:MAG: uncharacterized membrane protein YraQ (UPF0718 family) [Paracoccaceae bacterium]|jgi:uncharacterized membrane protein YraQ (UPF0718 family)
MRLLTLSIFAIGVARTWASPERTRALPSRRRKGAGDGLAAAPGVFTPFHWCSAARLFFGFVSAGAPRGVTFSFLIAAPMGAPMRTDAAGATLVVKTPPGKDAAPAFMMTVIVLSPRGMLILRQVLTLRRIAVFIGAVAGGIRSIGFMVNLMF